MKTAGDTSTEDKGVQEINLLNEIILVYIVISPPLSHTCPVLPTDIHWVLIGLNKDPNYLISFKTWIIIMTSHPHPKSFIVATYH